MPPHPSPKAAPLTSSEIGLLRESHSEVTRRAIELVMEPEDAGPECLRKGQAEWRVWSALASQVPVKERSVRVRTLTALLTSVTKALQTALDIQKDFELMELVIRDLEQAQRSIELSKSVSKLLGRNPERSLHWTSLVAVLKHPPKGARPFSDSELTKLVLASSSDWIPPPCPARVRNIQAKDNHRDVSDGGGAVLATNSLRVKRQRRGVAARKRTPARSRADRR